ncbi:MAG: EamA family transporter, partial [Candidatus Acidiferrales bacterium]
MNHASHSSAAAARGPGKLTLIFWLIVMLLLWSFNYIAGKIALRHMDPFSLTSFRFVLAALFMLPIYFTRPVRAKLRARDIWPFLYLGFFGVVLNQ